MKLGFTKEHTEENKRQTYSDTEAEKRGRRNAYEELFAKFDKYSCIKNDKWYSDFKEEKLREI
jgi:hypothetical protein